MMTDWIAIKNDYINTDISYRKLAGKYNVSFATLRERAKKENWVAQKETQHHNVSTKIAQKTQEVIVAKEVNRIDRINSLADKLIEKLEQASEQLDNYIVTNKKKVKTIEYDNNVQGKPAKEITTEVENLEIVNGIIDAKNLKQLASALKDIKDIQGSSNDVISTDSQVSELFKALESED